MEEYRNVDATSNFSKNILSLFAALTENHTPIGNNSANYKGVLCLDESINQNEEAFALLDKGRNFKVAPRNTKKVK